MALAIGTRLSDVFGQTLSAMTKHRKMGTIDRKPGSIAIVVPLPGFEIGSRAVIALENAGEVGTANRAF
ncbi:MAG: hypothetical protein M1378_01465 [Bacteroidetes bacterium]|nr:hypothetical protein [Bacteroidota bacterium]